MSNTLVIHVGVPKTGSTSIQKFLFENRGVLKKMGLEYHETHSVDRFNPDYWAHHLLAHKWGGWMNPKDYPISPDKAWDVLKNDLSFGENRTVLISSERFSDILSGPSSEKVFEFIKATLPNVNIKIMAYLRNQVSLVESFYKQQVKVGMSVLPLKDYLEIQTPDFLNYYEFFKGCSHFIGKDNIIFRSYENDILSNSNIICSFLKQFEIELPSRFYKKEERYNESTSTLSTALLSHPDLRKTQQRRRYRNAIRKLFDEQRTLNNTKPSLLSDVQKEYVKEKYQYSNGQLPTFFCGLDSSVFMYLDECPKTDHLEDVKFLISYREMLEFIKVFNEDLSDLP
ncbi:hypothetical protein MGA5115_03109 [Marinomonas gallaica]|uniref:Sulfotransferase domain-containing protein n=1 Tax=Marinomonas gallaica TaxID=1806667 RepID=A0A1C3JUM2_9GAMM|nr:hypothetical protein [Marinomonas gallaica]SBT18948.1 hypothetical protein MGA5115_03109 [Marinomonas gallaica]SBT21903.1 hypothetical protein MGA5116_02513 [Marinomonas gallaica]